MRATQKHADLPDPGQGRRRRPHAAAGRRYPFDPEKARQLLTEAGHGDGLGLELIAVTFNRKTFLAHLDQPKQTWDIALSSWLDPINFLLFEYFNAFVLNGASDWVEEEPELRHATNKAVVFEPQATGILLFGKSSVTDQHWSVRGRKP